MKGTFVIAIAASVAVFAQQAHAWAKSEVVASVLSSGDGISWAGKQIGRNFVLMFPVTSQYHDSIFIYFRDGECHDDIFDQPMFISQQFGRGGWYNWAIQDGGDIVMTSDRSSTFTIVGDMESFVIKDSTGRAVQRGGTMVERSLKVGDPSSALRFHLDDNSSCEHSLQNLIVQ